MTSVADGHLIGGVSFVKKLTRPLVLLWVFILISVFCSLFWPIFTSDDTDLWTHLDCGRFILQHFSIPVNSFWSFLSPQREWVDYSWFSQVLFFGSYSLFGYLGLIFLRTAVYFVTMAILSYFLLKDVRDDKWRWFFVFFIVLFGSALLLRDMSLRPYAFSYLCISLFIFILEQKNRRLIWLLPLIGVCWVNLYGIHYLIMEVILLAYLSEYLLSRFRSEKPDMVLLAAVVLTMASVFCTPHGMGILEVPFVFLSSEAEFSFVHLRETASLRAVFSPNAMPLLSYNALIFALFCVSVLAGTWAFIRRKLNISRLVLFITGVILLNGGVRFIFEFVLMLLPALKECSSPGVDSNRRRVSVQVSFLLSALLLVGETVYFKNFFAIRPRYPVSHANLPHGVAAFLNHAGFGGRVMNHPDTGGYLRWALEKKYSILMDLQFPRPFSESDLFKATSAYYDPESLAKLINESKPDFIVVPFNRSDTFCKLIKNHPAYKLVWVDDTSLLYADSARNPELDKDRTFEGLDPFEVVHFARSIWQYPAPDPLVSKAPGLLSIDPESRVSNWILGTESIRAGDLKKALKHSQAIADAFPEMPDGYILEGHAWSAAGSLDNALSAYKRALSRANPLERIELYRWMGMIEIKKGKYQKAYHSLRRGVIPFAQDVSSNDLYWFGVAALESGKTKTAIKLFRYAYWKLPSENTELRSRLERVLSVIPQD